MDFLLTYFFFGIYLLDSKFYKKNWSERLEFSVSKQGSFIPVIIDITANHQGYFVFKLCANNDIFQDPKQACFDANPLWVKNFVEQFFAF